MAGVFRMQAAYLRKLLPRMNRRLISTSKKNSESVAETATECTTKIQKRNWISYGFDESSEAADLNAMHSIMFAAVTCCLVGGGFFLFYVPDFSMADWSQREAFLELKRREDAGLPLIDRNLIDPSRIHLPSDEELADTDIII